MKKTRFKLKKGRDIKRVLKKGLWKTQKNISVYCYKNNLKYCRIAICVSKKNGISVERNLLKRWIREAHRNLVDLEKAKGLDIVIMPKKDTKTLDVTYNDVYNQLKCIYSQSNLIKKV
ncbi:MAG: ribonuclease P protein component [Clostridia bacterium]